MSATIIRWVTCGSRTVAATADETDAQACARGVTPTTIPAMNYVDPTNANYGLSPSGPDAPAKDPVTGILTTVYGDTTTGGKANAKAKSAKSSAAGGCCAPGEPKCLWCWLKENWIQLAILALSVAAFVTRKK